MARTSFSYQDSRVPVCTIRLHPIHSFVATGNKEGVVEVTNYLKPLVGILQVILAHGFVRDVLV